MRKGIDPTETIEVCGSVMTAHLLNLNGSTEGHQIMRSIFAGTIVLSASMSVVYAAPAEKQTYMQAVIGHGQPIQAGQDKTIGADQVHSGEDDLTRRIEQDNTRLDRLTDICPSC
jgi:hypothetical protein